jgi:hypothetical protein
MIAANQLPYFLLEFAALVMSNESLTAERARQLLVTQRLLQDALQQLLALPDVKPVGRESSQKAQDAADECNYALHKCECAWKQQEQMHQQARP